MLLTIVSLVLALSIMVLVHEIGHLVAAKRAGIVVREFGLGYPPRVLKLWRGRGKAIVGGKTLLIPHSFSWPEDVGVGSLALYKAAPDAKGRLVVSEVLAAEGEEQDEGAAGRVEFLDRGTLYSVNAIPFGGFALMLGEEDPTFPGSFASKGRLTRIWVLVAGSAMNLLTAVLFFSLAYGLGAPESAEPPNVLIRDVVPGSPAEGAGLQPGDIIARTDGIDVLTTAGLGQYVRDHKGTPVVLSLLRAGAELTVTVTPRVESPAGEGPMGIIMDVRQEIVHYPVLQAVWLGARKTATLAGLVLSVPVQLIRGMIPAELARPVGPVGIGQIMGDAVRYSLDTGWWFPVSEMLGSLSVALAVTNLLPLPGLDGGRILFVVVEAIRRRRVDPARESLVHLMGIALLLVLMLLITWQDIVNPLPSLDWSQLF